MRRLLLILICASGLVGCRSDEWSHVAAVQPVEADGIPRVLVVVAHPDDEIAFGGALYKTASFLGGVCDVLCITNGEGGFKYSTLSEDLYDAELTDEAVGRELLAEIRERELIEGCRYLGVREIEFLREWDHRYTQDVLEVLGPGASVWDLERVRTAIRRRLAIGYDFVLVLPATDTTHGHHKAAAVLTAQAVATLPEDDRPALLCAVSGDEAEAPIPPPPVLAGFPETELLLDSEGLVFDRTQSFGYKDRLDYRIVVNWAIAAHKSQGTMQMLMGRGEREHYYVFRVSGPKAVDRARRWFRWLAEPQFTSRTYEPSAGTNTGR